MENVIPLLQTTQVPGASLSGSVLSFIVVITLARVRQNDKSPPRDTKCATRPDHGHHLQQSQTVYDRRLNLMPSQWVGWMMVGWSAVPAVGWMADVYVLHYRFNLEITDRPPVFTDLIGK